jgi:YVTN family beta-propeller protein
MLMRYIVKSLFIFFLLFFSFFFLKNIGFSTGTTPVIPLEANPYGIAINPITDIAVVANEKSDSVSIVDLSTQKVLSTIPVGKAPRGVFIDKETNIALVSNSKNDTVSVIDLNTFSVIKTIPVGKEPEGIAINPLTHKALVTNHKDDTVSVLDLVNFNVIKTISVGREPIDVAIDPDPESSTGLALVVNEKDYTVSIIDLDTYKVTQTIQAGKKPHAIDINPETHLAAVVNEKDNSITVINLQTLQTNAIPVGKHPIDVAINPLDNRALVICDEDRSLLLIDLETKTIIKTYSLDKLPRGVAVNNFTNIAGVVDEKTDSLTLIQLPNPVPEILSITPNDTLRGSNEITINIEGNRFVKSSTSSIRLPTADYGLSTVFVDNHHIQATISKDMLLKAGVFSLTIANPQPDGGTSNSINFAVNNPVPSITALEPAEAMAGTQSLTLNIYGTGFFDDTTVYFGGAKKPTTFINSTRLQIGLASEDLKTPGKYEVMAYNLPPGGGSSNKVIFAVKTSLEITITSPLDGTTINRAKVMVRGSFKSGTQDIGITVNGILAEIRGSEWVANNVPLTVGTNTITATLKDSSGSTATTSITINTTETSQPVELSANITSGIAPLQVYFSISTSFSPSSYQIDFEGDGVIDYTGSTFDNISHTYTSEGIFYPTVKVTDEQGNTYTDTIAITVMNKAEIDALLKSKWEGMKAAIENKDIEGAVGFFVESSREMYRYNFNLMSSILPIITKDFGNVRLIKIYDDVAECEMLAIQDGVEYSFYVEFVKDSNGIWKLRFF